MSIPNMFALYEYPANTNLGSGGFAEILEFTAPTLASALIVGGNAATMFQKSLLLTQKYGISSASYISFIPSQSLSLTPLPSGISY